MRNRIFTEFPIPQVDTTRTNVGKIMQAKPLLSLEELSLIEPINGIVQPPVIPPSYRPGRKTNQLAYMKKVLKRVWRHMHAWPFHGPVNAKVLKIPASFFIQFNQIFYLKINYSMQKYILVLPTRTITTS